MCAGVWKQRTRVTALPMHVQTHTAHLPGRCHPDLSRLPSHISAWVLSSSLSMGAAWPGREESTYSLPRALQSDGWDVPSERWDLPSWPREELSWGQRSYISTETAKQAPAQAWQHVPLGGTSHSALDAGAPFSLAGRRHGLPPAKQRGTVPWAGTQTSSSCAQA